MAWNIREMYDNSIAQYGKEKTIQRFSNMFNSNQYAISMDNSLWYPSMSANMDGTVVRNAGLTNVNNKQISFSTHDMRPFKPGTGVGADFDEFIDILSKSGAEVVPMPNNIMPMGLNMDSTSYASYLPSGVNIQQYSDSLLRQFSNGEITGAEYLNRLKNIEYTSKVKNTSKFPEPIRIKDGFERLGNIVYHGENGEKLDGYDYFWDKFDHKVDDITPENLAEITKERNRVEKAASKKIKQQAKSEKKQAQQAAKEASQQATNNVSQEVVSNVIAQEASNVTANAGANTPETSGAGGGGNQPPQTTTAAPEAGKPRRRGQQHLTSEDYEIINGYKPYYRESFNDVTSQFKGEVPPPEDPKITQAVDEWMKEDAVKQQRQLDMNNTDYNLQHHPEIYNNHSDRNANFSEEMYKEYEKTHGKPYGSTVQSNDPHNTTQRVVDEAIDNKHVENQYDNKKFNTQEQVKDTVNNNATPNTTINNDKNTNTMNTNKPDSTIYTQEDDKAFKDHMENIKNNHDATKDIDTNNHDIDTIEQMYQNGQLTDSQYAETLNNAYERRKYIEEQSLPMDERLERVEQRYASGEYDDKRYATELNKIYESNDVPTMQPSEELSERVLEKIEQQYANGDIDDITYADKLNKFFSAHEQPTMTPEMARRKQTSQNSTKYKNVFEQFHAENRPKKPNVQPGPTNPIIDNNLPIPQAPIETGPKMNTNPVPLNNAIENVMERNRPKTSKFGTVMSAFNLAMSAKAAVDTYKKSRAEGRGAVSSAVRAGGSALITNSLGPISSVLVPMAYAAPGAIMSGMDMLHKEYRRMNSSSNFIPFGKAEFQDSQDLATMRQAGMELAKMSRYNLEQTLMGAEAKHLHR